MRLRWDWDEIEMRLRSATIRWDNAVCSSRLAGLAVQWHICDISVFSYPCLVVSYPCLGSTVTAAHCYPGWWCVGLQVLHTVAVSGGVLAYRFYTPWLSRQRRYKWQGRKKIYLLDLLTAVILQYPGWKYVGLLFMHGGCLNIQEGRKEMFYLMMHSTHFIYSYMASNILWRTTPIAREEICCKNMCYSFRLTARVLLYAPSHRQDSTYHSLCYIRLEWEIAQWVPPPPMRDWSDDALWENAPPWVSPYRFKWQGKTLLFR